MKELSTKDLDEPDYYDDVVSHPEPDTLDYEVKWALRSTAVNKANGSEELPAELFKSLKEDAIKILHSLRQQMWTTQQWPQDWKRPILIPIPKKDGTKEYANHQTIAFISQASKVMLKILPVGFSIMQNKNFQMSKVGLEKEEELVLKSPTFTGLQRKQENFR